MIQLARRLAARSTTASIALLTAVLDTIGPRAFGGALKSPMTAYPKRCPLTGDLRFFGYRLCPPFLTYVVFMDLPVVFDAAAATAGGPPWPLEPHTKRNSA
ncbi:carotenoid oxygenase family protein [Mycobacteroides abscessus subsp. abscessus]|nr:carotenoid oxygenase family protein [Mycobacteroides abscessus subsp. abscessus]